MLYIIIVSWNVRDLLRQCLASLAANPIEGMRQQVIVVDNASTDGTPDMVRREFPATHLIANTTNRGFTGGNNDGLAFMAQSIAQQQAQSTTTEPYYLFLLNPDTEVKPHALTRLAAFIAQHPKVGMVGPRLWYGNGSAQSSRRRFPTLRTAIFEATWFQKYAPHGWMERYYMRDTADDQVNAVDWLVGAAMFVRYEAYQQVGPLDERTFFMYSEEVDWCKRFKNAGWQIYYIPDAEVIHYEGQSSKQVSTQRDIRFHSSKVRYFAKHHGRLQAAFLRQWLLGQYHWQIFLEAAKWLLGNQREIRATRIRAYRAVVASGLR